MHDFFGTGGCKEGCMHSRQAFYQMKDILNPLHWDFKTFHELVKFCKTVEHAQGPNLFYSVIIPSDCFCVKASFIPHWRHQHDLEMKPSIQDKHGSLAGNVSLLNTDSTHQGRKIGEILPSFYMLSAWKEHPLCFVHSPSVVVSQGLLI